MRKQHQEITNTTVLVTGGSSGIGKALALELVKENNTVIICGRDSEKLQLVRDQDPRIITRVCDITDNSAREELIQWVSSEFPDFSVLINNAGGQQQVDLSKDSNKMDIAKQELELNFLSHVSLCELILPHFRLQEHAKIINLTTGLIYLPKASISFYCAAKAALHSYTQSLRVRLTQTNIRVIEIMPPLVDTPFHQGSLPNTIPSLKASDVVKSITKGLNWSQEEVLIGKSKMAKFLSNFAPNQGLKLINR